MKTFIKNITFGDIIQSSHKIHHIYLIYNITILNSIISIKWDYPLPCKIFLNKGQKCRKCNLIMVYLNWRVVVMNHIGTAYRTAEYHLVLWSLAFVGHTWITAFISLYHSYSWRYECLSLDCEPLKGRNDVFAVHLFIFSI